MPEHQTGDSEEIHPAGSALPKAQPTEHEAQLGQERTSGAPTASTMGQSRDPASEGGGEKLDTGRLGGSQVADDKDKDSGGGVGVPSLQGSGSGEHHDDTTTSGQAPGATDGGSSGPSESGGEGHGPEGGKDGGFIAGDDFEAGAGEGGKARVPQGQGDPVQEAGSQTGGGEKFGGRPVHQAGATDADPRGTSGSGEQLRPGIGEGPGPGGA